jgi:ribosomal-protein-alanine N-acetyltransferase
MIRTERLLLRPLHQDDLPHLQQYATRPEFYHYLPIVEQTPDTVAVFLEQRLAEAKDPEKQHWVFALEPHGAGHLIGTVRLSITSNEHRIADIGYGLNSDFQRLGYMTEAVQAVLKFGFGDLGMHRIWATTDVENIASCRVLEKAGMVQEGWLRQDKLVRGQWRDSFLYAILEGELE